MIALNDYLRGCRIVDPETKKVYQSSEIDLTVNSHRGYFSSCVLVLADGCSIQEPIIQPCSQVKDSQGQYIYADDIIERIHFNPENVSSNPVNVDRYFVIAFGGKFFFKPIDLIGTSKNIDWNLEPVDLLVHEPDAMIQVIGNLQTWEDSIPLS